MKNERLFRSVLEPLNEKGDVISRGKAILAARDPLSNKFAAALKRAPGLVAIRITHTSGQVDTYTKDQVAEVISNGVQGKAMPAPEPVEQAEFQQAVANANGVNTYEFEAPAAPAPEAAAPAKPKGPYSKSKKKKDSTEPSGKPGVIDEIVNILKIHGTDKGVTIPEIVSALKSKFPTRDEKGMEITVRCQLARLPKQRNLNIKRVKEGRVSHYTIAA